MTRPLRISAVRDHGGDQLSVYPVTRSIVDASDPRRRQNLSSVLKLVHRQNGLSRSVMTARTGLNRSTIAALVGELVDIELVVETEPDIVNRVGRPSPVIRPNPLGVTVSVNPEIDAITVAVVGFGGRIVDRERRDVLSIPSPEEATSITVDLVAGLLARSSAVQRVIGIGVAIPGLVSSIDGIVRLAPHLGWVDVPFASMLSEATGFEVHVANDASLGCLAESAFGAGRDVDHVVYFNGGASGIGGGVFVNGAPLTGLDGHAGEFGHSFVRTEGIPCHCGARGCLETEVRREPLLQLLGLDDARADELEEALAATSDAAVIDEVHRQLGYLAIALSNAINILNPRLVILGGFLGFLYARDAAYLEGLVSASSLDAPRASVRIEVAGLGADTLLIGAAELAFEATLADPASFARG